MVLEAAFTWSHWSFDGRSNCLVSALVAQPVWLLLLSTWHVTSICVSNHPNALGRRHSIPQLAKCS